MNRLGGEKGMEGVLRCRTHHAQLEKTRIGETLDWREQGGGEAVRGALGASNLEGGENAT